MNSDNPAIPEQRHYECHTEIGPKQRCGRTAWGDSPFCRWHNASLTVFMLSIILAMEDPRNKHLRGTPFRARYDPEFANVFWRSCRTPLGFWIGLFVRVLAVAVVVMGALVFTLTIDWPAEWRDYLILGPAALGVIGLLGMFFGSTKLLYPMLVPFAAGLTIVFQLAAWAVFGLGEEWMMKAVQAIAIAMIFVGLSPLFPPKSSQSFDPRDKMQLPP